jgi:Protein of unknown function (DUF2934)
MLDESEQAIRERAYAIWEQDGRPEGRSLAHWSQAEVEIGTEQTVSIVEKRKCVKSRTAQGAARQQRLRESRAQLQARNAAEQVGDSKSWRHRSGTA